MRYAKKMTEEDFKKWIREDFFNILIKNSKYTKDDFIKEWDNPTGILEYDIINNICHIPGNYELFDEDKHPEFAKARKDLNKVKFDFENLEIGLDINGKNDDRGELNIHEYNGVCLLLCCAGGDWENPVYFVLYVDHKNKLRAYIPSNGNTYCKKYKCAYGGISEYVEDYYDLPEEDQMDIDNLDEEGMSIEPNIISMLQDASHRITILESNCQKV